MGFLSVGRLEDTLLLCLLHFDEETKPIGVWNMGTAPRRIEK
ncbi:hypothetical protein CLOSTMETH_03700 [[Clostridium] methylpentosum DSM 5476]|uniref:Uncharacterized protein n=1 Tax=[Clostridium] methylpentosum DSM 5476 TaxID=537013 RepID=C0EIK5_9FIRM|nr:hypothetical protein CLOSTMETH_03700 [[Clostridium] methylpentosum DSM 5476]